MGKQLTPLMRAFSEPEIVEAVAQRAWKKDKRPGEPETPTGDELAEWAPEAPEGARRESEDRLRQLNWSFRCGVPNFGLLIEGETRRWRRMTSCPLVGGKPATIGFRPGYHGLRDHEILCAVAVWPENSGLVLDTCRPLPSVHIEWCLWRLAGRPLQHPLTPILRAYWDRPRHPTRRHLLVREGRGGLVVSRTPGLLSLACNEVLEAVFVDGDPFATRQLGSPKLRRYRVVRPEPADDLFPASPRRLAGTATAGAVIQAVADLPLASDERHPIRADLLRLGALAFALSGAIRLTEAEGAYLVGGRDTTANRRRFNEALWAIRSLRVETRPGIHWALADAEPGEVNRLGPARWMLDKAQEGKPIAFRYTGALFRSATKWGTVERTVAGLEGALAWGPSPGKGRGGRLPNALVPVRPGGPGPEVFVPWWVVLRLAGEKVDADENPKGAAGRRYGRRRTALEQAGYFTPRGGTAEAGDTVEIVKAVKGGRHHQAGLLVRASARWCAACGRGAKQVWIPATGLLGSP